MVRGLPPNLSMPLVLELLRSLWLWSSAIFRTPTSSSSTRFLPSWQGEIHLISMFSTGLLPEPLAHGHIRLLPKGDALSLKILKPATWVFRYGLLHVQPFCNASYATYQVGQLSKQDLYWTHNPCELLLAIFREHPELSEGLCVEMMTRQLADSGAHTLQHQVLTALTPWMENLIFRPRWEGHILSPFIQHQQGSHKIVSDSIM